MMKKIIILEIERPDFIQIKYFSDKGSVNERSKCSKEGVHSASKSRSKNKCDNRKAFRSVMLNRV